MIAIPIRRVARFAIVPAVTLAMAVGTAPATQAQQYLIPGGTDLLTTTEASITVDGQENAINFVGCGTGDDTQVQRGDIVGTTIGQDPLPYAAEGSTTTTVTSLCLVSDQGPGGRAVPLFVTLQTMRSPAEQASFGPGVPSVGTMHVLFAPAGNTGNFTSFLNINYDVRSGCATCAILAPGLTTGTITAWSVPWTVGPLPSTASVEPFCHSNGGGSGHLHCVAANPLAPFVPGSGPEECVPGSATRTCVGDVEQIAPNATVGTSACGLAVCWVGGVNAVNASPVGCNLLYSDTQLPNLNEGTNGCGVAAFSGTYLNTVCGTGTLAGGTMTGMTEKHDPGSGSAAFNITFIGGLGILQGTALEPTGPSPAPPAPATIRGIALMTSLPTGIPNTGPGNGPCMFAFDFQSLDLLTEDTTQP